ncbi:tyrosine--tRNA ligase [Bacteriovoracaceae bacterium]|nr:tyrosine--tRNA ligase [Bacteriovoracaceae bacterium]
MGRKINVTPEEQFAELKRGSFEIIPEDDFIKKLKKSYEKDEPLRVKFGADPSRPDIHLGHTVVLNKLRLLQEFGHEIYFLIGDFTARIGDPSGKSKTRPILTSEEIIENAQTYKDQVGKILDMKKAKVVFNNDWLAKLTPFDIVKLVSQVTVSGILRRDDFSKRYAADQAIYLHEFLYPVFQGYDSVALKSDLELGGTDQTFNLMVGRDLQKAYGQESQAILTMPILEGLDGINKMSKSLDNYIGINESAENIFGKVMSISDEMMIKYYQLLSRKKHQEILEVVEGLKSGSKHPMEAKKEIAQELVEIYYPGEGKLERDKFEARFSKNKIPDDVQTLELAAQELDLIKIFSDLKFVKSNGEARRLMKQNAVKVDGTAFKEQFLSIESGSEYILKVGKLRMVKVKCV